MRNSAEVKDFIRQNYKTMSVNKMSSELGFTWERTNRILKRLGLAPLKEPKLIVKRPDVMSLVKTYHDKMTVAELACLANVSYYYMYRLLKENGLSTIRKCVRLTEFQKLFIQHHADKMNYNEISKMLVLSPCTVKDHLINLGMYQASKKKTILMRKDLTDFIEANYDKMTGAEIARKFNVAKHCVNRYKKQKGLKTPQHLIYSAYKSFKENNCAKKLTDSFVARTLSFVDNHKIDHDKANEYLKYPELIELKRQQLLLNRKIKEHDRNAN